MKLTKEEKKKFKDMENDNEEIHGLYDDLMRARLEELDPEFMKDLEEARGNTAFWYA